MYQIRYRLIRKRAIQFSVIPNASRLILSNLLKAKNSCNGRTFDFLNQKVTFDEIDWNYSKNGKLWTYNLNYFDFLFQDDVTIGMGEELMVDFCKKHNQIRDGYEPYPISLRAINWVKFCSLNAINKEEINRQLYCDLYRLKGQLEYHILANHLLENGFGLLFGSYYFQDEILYKEAKRIIVNELKEQILPDGAHYELSPMYHNIILGRLLDCYNLIINNTRKNHELQNSVLGSIKKMLSWSVEISFADGEIPMLNDSAPNIAPSTKKLVEYAQILNIDFEKFPMSSSGYRKLINSDFECIVDIGQVAPKYQPGHSHADSLNFVLNFNGSPLIVDVGVSTYEKNERRQLERSTISHNTVVINNSNSSEVWGGFRVGRRAESTVLLDTKNHVRASHNGYRNQSTKHLREFILDESGLKILDEVSSRINVQAIGYIHLCPEVNVLLEGQRIIINESVEIEFVNTTSIKIDSYLKTEGFNRLVPARKIVYSFNKVAQINVRKRKI
jgi:hypothetical protein